MFAPGAAGLEAKGAGKKAPKNCSGSPLQISRTALGHRLDGPRRGCGVGALR
eukprot:CAMPEP_0197914662 /NCGR_PEP_ID=MMETSP1439-20131203/78892_1 /TAXON_ID=66791 /ORGANISM="Gonyaulax spinifera, Strain CCMP409" /LENGTH=51 /DNA_ID=CAMNT_0043536585 /DNA_START=36 /DNA_END=187 /DNA_ORIENTATION=-